VKNNVQFKRILLGGAAVGMFMIPALAQQQTEVVTVTGIRASLESAQSIKQNANQVVDSITNVDIGALPDRNVAEALQRVPGVTLQRNDAPNDLVRMGSTGNSVFIRGLSWVQTTFNGRDEFSAINGRTMSFADVSADLLSGVDVYKSPTASMIEGGIGGVVDLKTHKPFDFDGRKIAVSGDYTYGEMSDRALPSVNGLFSDRWNTGIGEIGFLASVDWQDQLTSTTGINLYPFDCYNSAGSIYQATATDNSYSTCLADSGHVMKPQGFAYREVNFRQQRLAGTAVLQWRPTDRLEFTFSGMNTYAHFTDLEHYVQMDSKAWADYGVGSTYVNKQWVKGTGKLTTIDTRAGTGHNRTSEIAANVKWTPTDNLDISVDLQYVDSNRQYLNNSVFTGYLPSTIMTYDLTDRNNPKISWDSAANTEDPNNYFWYADMDHMEYNSAHSYAARIDATYRFDGDGLFGFVKSLDAGFRSQNKLSVARATGYNWASINPINWWIDGGYTLGGTWFSYTGATQFTNSNGELITSAAISDGFKKMNTYGQLYSYPLIYGVKVPKLWVPSRDLALTNTYDLTTLYRPVQPGWGWQSYTYNVDCKQGITCIKAYENTTVGGSVTGNTISPQTQDTYAGYFQANYASQNPFGWGIPIDGNIGVRIVSTKHVVEHGKLVMPAAPNVAAAYLGANGCNAALGNPMKAGDPTTVVTSCADFNTALNFWGDYAHAAYAVVRPDPVTTDYIQALPSFNFRALLSDQLQARLAYSETMLRPEFAYTSNDGSLSFNWGDSSSSQAFSSATVASGYEGNPNLKPMHSKNYDFSLEWYFSPSGSVTVSLFNKYISNYIYTRTATTPVTNPYSGVTMNFSDTSYVNGAKGGVDGFELDYHQFYDFLPGFWGGFGLEANYTKIWNWGGHNNSGNITASDAVASGNATLPMEGMSKDSYNLALMYSKYDIDARLAWNWRSTYMSSSANSNAPRTPVWVENYGQLDGSVFYSFLDHFKAGIQVTNITGSKFNTDQGYGDYHPRVNWIAHDRSYSVVLRTSW
jgi:TonB-dependent receptor